MKAKKKTTKKHTKVSKKSKKTVKRVTPAATPEERNTFLKAPQSNIADIHLLQMRSLKSAGASGIDPDTLAKLKV